jgi:uncharacterized repeat protein (TIGR03803 family)
MKTHIKNLFVLPVLMAGLGLMMLAGPATAQVFKTLHTFTGGSDGANPFAGLILSGSTLYGTADSGGSSGYGTLFAINTSGTGFRVLVSFNGVNDGSGSSPYFNRSAGCSDRGADPGLIPLRDPPHSSLAIAWCGRR